MFLEFFEINFSSQIIHCHFSHILVACNSYVTILLMYSIMKKEDKVGFLC